jgi:hypothetical protein
MHRSLGQFVIVGAVGVGSPCALRARRSVFVVGV